MTELTENEFERFHNHIVFRCDLYNVFYFPEFLQGLTIIPYNSKFSYCFSNHLYISISNFFNNLVKQHWTIRQGRNNRRGPERQNELLQVTEYNKHLLCQALCVCVCTQMHGAREIEIYLPVLVFVIIFTPNVRNLFVSLILQIFVY